MVNPNAQLVENIFSKPELVYHRDGYGEGLVEVGRKNPNVVALCADLTESTRTLAFKQEYPDRFVEIGVAEQNMASLASGFALAGKIPFIASYAVFSPGRNWEQIRTTICYNDVNVKIVGAHAGISVGPDGATHQALEDIAITRALPNMTVIAPCDALEVQKAVVAAAAHLGPVYIRFGREKIPIITSTDTPFTIGATEEFWQGMDVTIIACGAMVYGALEAARKLEGEISVRVLNCHTVKPIDEIAISKAASETGCIVTAEEHQINGGLGSAVAEVISRTHPVPIEMIGVRDRFGESGTPRELFEAFRLGTENIVQAVHKVLERKK